MNKKNINKRFITAVNWLIESKKAGNKSEIAKTLGIKPTTLSEILNNRMNVATDLAAMFCFSFNISADWLLIGKEPMYKDPEHSGIINYDHASSEKKVAESYLQYNQKDSNELLYKMSQVLTEIATLKKQLNDLQKQIDPSQESINNQTL